MRRENKYGKAPKYSKTNINQTKVNQTETESNTDLRIHTTEEAECIINTERIRKRHEEIPSIINFRMQSNKGIFKNNNQLSWQILSRDNSSSPLRSSKGEYEESFLYSERSRKEELQDLELLKLQAQE